MDNEAYEKEQVSSSQCLHHEEVESSPPPSPPPDYTDAPPEFKADTDIPDVKIITPAAPVEVNLSISELERVRNDSIQEGSSVCACEESNSSCNCRSSTSVTSKTPLTMTSPSAATKSQGQVIKCCSKCRPIYQRQGQATVTLDPARLLEEVSHGHAATHLPPSQPVATQMARSQPKKADKMSLFQDKGQTYGSMCACADLGVIHPNCANHQASKWQLCLPRNSPWWPTVKRCLLIIAALIPIVFFIVYIVLHLISKR